MPNTTKKNKKPENLPDFFEFTEFRHNWKDHVADHLPYTQNDDGVIFNFVRACYHLTIDASNGFAPPTKRKGANAQVFLDLIHGRDEADRIMSGSGGYAKS